MTAGDGRSTPEPAYSPHSYYDHAGMTPPPLPLPAMPPSPAGGAGSAPPATPATPATTASSAPRWPVVAAGLSDAVDEATREYSATPHGQLHHQYQEQLQQQRASDVGARSSGRSGAATALSPDEFEEMIFRRVFDAAHAKIAELGQQMTSGEVCAAAIASATAAGANVYLDGPVEEFESDDERIRAEKLRAASVAKARGTKTRARPLRTLLRTGRRRLSLACPQPPRV